MTRDELRVGIGRALCSLKDMPGECAHCAADKGCPDSWPEDAEKVDAIMDLVDTYSVGVVQESPTATMAQTNRTVQIPLTGAPWALLQIPYPMTEVNWSEMEKLLNLMKKPLTTAR